MATAPLRAVRFAGRDLAAVLLEPRRDRVVFRCSARSAQSKAQPERAWACARSSRWLTQNATRGRAAGLRAALRGSNRLGRLAQFQPLRRRRIAVAQLDAPHAGEKSRRLEC